MKYTFIGDPNDGFSGPAVLTLFGVDFPKNEPVEVSEDVGQALAGNNHFKAAGRLPQLDHDGDGQPGGSKPRRKKAAQS